MAGGHFWRWHRPSIARRWPRCHGPQQWRKRVGDRHIGAFYRGRPETETDRSTKTTGKPQDNSVDRARGPRSHAERIWRPVSWPRSCPYHGRELLELAILSLFTLLFAWVSLGFWTAMSGFVLLCLGRDRYAITRSAPPGTALPAEARTAVVMPIRNEDVARVFAGIRATYESVARAGTLAHFDFFVLSDSNEPDTLTAERHAWRDLCAASTASATSSIAGGDTTSSARAATSRTSAGAGAASTGTWSSWTPTAS